MIARYLGIDYEKIESNLQLKEEISRKMIEIFEYTVATELYREGRTTEFDVMIRYKGELYFYMNEVLLLKLKKNTENFTII